MTIDKVICKNLETNPIVNYGIFMNSILPFINNIYLNNKEKVKKLLQNSIKKTFEKSRAEYTHTSDFMYRYDGMSICNLIGDTQVDDINIGLTCEDIIRYELIDIILKNDESLRYYFETDIVVNDKWLTNDDLNNYINTKKKIGTKNLYYTIDNDGYWNGVKYTYRPNENKNENENENKYPFVIGLTLIDEIDKTSDEWIRFKKIIIEENFKKKVSDCDDEETRDNLINIHNEEMNFLKKMFLDRLLDVFN